ncbi:MAG: hypothetical protein GY822_04410 [Deltaproteobacteria bacterium]|nr:hypothetical protein [Deltaproteobacteria bacterium]
MCFNLSQVDQDPKLYKEVLSLLDDAVAEGIPLRAQCAGRSIGIVMCW